MQSIHKHSDRKLSEYFFISVNAFRRLRGIWGHTPGVYVTRGMVSWFVCSCFSGFSEWIQLCRYFSFLVPRLFNDQGLYWLNWRLKTLSSASDHSNTHCSFEIKTISRCFPHHPQLPRTSHKLNYYLSFICYSCAFELQTRPKHFRRTIEIII